MLRVQLRLLSLIIILDLGIRVLARSRGLRLVLWEEFSKAL